MKPTDKLRSEHEVIEHVLDVLERASSVLESDGMLPEEFLPSAIDFVRSFADGFHHAKEEGMLFPRMKERGVPDHEGPVGVMLHEHDLGRAFIRQLEEAMGQDDRPQMIEALHGYIALLRQHILKENQILFPMAEQVLGPEGMQGLTADFERVEREEFSPDVRTRYEAVAEQLERALP